MSSHQRTSQLVNTNRNGTSALALIGALLLIGCGQFEGHEGTRVAKGECGGRSLCRWQDGKDWCCCKEGDGDADGDGWGWMDDLGDSCIVQQVLLTGVVTEGCYWLNRDGSWEEAPAYADANSCWAANRCSEGGACYHWGSGPPAPPAQPKTEEVGTDLCGGRGLSGRMGYHEPPWNFCYCGPGEEDPAYPGWGWSAELGRSCVVRNGAEDYTWDPQ